MYSEWKVKFFFAWYDIWVGVFVSSDHSVYVCPLPCCVFRFYRELILPKEDKE
jgi:hypothetical protein